MEKLFFKLFFISGLILYPTIAQGVTFTSDTLIDAGNYNYDGNDIIVDGCVLTVNGVHAFDSLEVINGGMVTHSAAEAGQADYKIHLTITKDVNIGSGCSISAGGKGYGPAQGPGKGTLEGSYLGGGGGYGGYGGDGRDGTGGSSYGSITEPTDLGSGGSGYSGGGNTGGEGGGAVRLTVGGILTLNGSLTADGHVGSTTTGGGGSGGSIYLSVGVLAGTGVISANGADGGVVVSGSAGGGRWGFKKVFSCKFSIKLSRKRRFLTFQGDFGKIIDIVMRKLCCLRVYLGNLKL